jgi:hypothetical protein
MTGDHRVDYARYSLEHNVQIASWIDERITDNARDDFYAV